LLLRSSAARHGQSGRQREARARDAARHPGDVRHAPRPGHAVRRHHASRARRTHRAARRRRSPSALPPHRRGTAYAAREARHAVSIRASRPAKTGGVMNSRLARWLTSLYPPAWRGRHGSEFPGYLEAQPATLPAILNVIGSALGEQRRASGDFHMDARQRTLVLMAFAYLAAVAAGVNFYWTVNDTPLATAMRSHTELSASFRAVALGSLAAFAVVIAMALPITGSISVDAVKRRRWGTPGRLAG